MKDGFDLINPEALGAPKGFSHGVLAPEAGRLLCVAGQVGWNADQEFTSAAFVDQFGLALDNVIAVVREAGGEPHQIVRLTIYVVDKSEYSRDLAAVGAAYRARMGLHFPAMTLVEVSALLEPEAQVEIEATAVIPAGERV